MAVTIRPLSPHPSLDPATCEAIAQTAVEVLGDLRDDVTVSFGTWDDGERMRYVCKVETPAGDPLGDRPPWRMWSGLFESPDELRAELETRLAGRLAPRRAIAAPAPRETAAAVL
jgi:hypothetical protein